MTQTGKFLLAPLAFVCACALGVGLLSLFPAADIAISGVFYDQMTGHFPAQISVIWQFIHESVQWAARGLGVIFILGVLASLTFQRFRKNAWGHWRIWVFLLASLLIGPGLVANVALKDQWGRARPVQIEVFGGEAHFTPALVPSHACADNCSFVAGDAAFGFWLVAFAFVCPLPLARRLFWLGVTAGLGLGLMRMAMGAHFASDVLAAGVAMLVSVAVVYRFVFDGRLLAERGTVFTRGLR